MVHEILQLTPDLVEKGWTGGELGVVNTIRPELGTESSIWPGEVWGVGGVLVFRSHEVNELRLGSALTHAREQGHPRRRAWPDSLISRHHGRQAMLASLNHTIHPKRWIWRGCSVRREVSHTFPS